jgi:hypothetical protein
VTALCLLIAIAAQTAPLGVDPAAALLGRWTADKLAMLEAMPEYQRIQQETARQAFKDTFLRSMPETTFVFKGSAFTLTLGPDETVVSYRIVKTEGRRVLIRTTETRGGTTDEDEVEAEFVDADTVTLVKKGDPFTFRLKRVKTPPPV